MSDNVFPQDILDHGKGWRYWTKQHQAIHPYTRSNYLGFINGFCK
jgi:hypothetical protein